MAFATVVISNEVSAQNPGIDIDALQQAIDMAGADWIAGDTPMSVLSSEQRSALLLPIEEIEERNARPESDSPLMSTYSRVLGPDVDPSMSRLDWHDINGEDWTSPVRQQGICGSCWAFGPIAAAETWINILKDNPHLDFDLSEQYMVSCAQWGSCAYGGNPDVVLDFMQTTGVPDEVCMPYKSGDTGMDGVCTNKCADWASRVVKITNWGQIRNSIQNQAQIKNLLAQGPMSMSMDVYADFSAYTGGVYQHVSGASEGGHALTLIGWDDSHNSWIIKNSWGVMWGEAGFAEMVKTDISINNKSWEWLNMPNPPLLGIPCIEEDALAIEAYQGGLPGEVTIEVSNCGEQTLHWSSEPYYGSVTGWMSTDPTQGTLNVGASTEVTIYADPEGLAPQVTRFAGLTIKGDHRDADLPVTFSVKRPTPPQARFTADPQSGKAPLEVQFTLEATGTFDTIEWDFGDGETSSDQNPAHIYKDPGNYTVKLTVSGTSGNSTKEKENLIKVSGENVDEDAGTDDGNDDDDDVDVEDDYDAGSEEYGAEESVGGCGCNTPASRPSGNGLLTLINLLKGGLK